MIDYDPRLAAGLRTLAEDSTTTQPPPAERLMRRGRQVRRRRAAVRLTASMAALVVVAGGVATAAALQGRDPGAVARDSGPAGQVVAFDLVSAVEKTSGGSFVQRIAIAVRDIATLPADVRKNVAVYDGMRLEGPFDPQARKGSLLTTLPGGDTGEQRLVDGDLYVGDGKVWKHPPGKHTTFSVASTVTDDIALSADPAAFLDTLRKLGSVKATGTAGTYEFSGDLRGGDGQQYRITGTVAATADGKLAKVVYNVPLWLTGGRPAVTVTVTIELSEHGTPVTVQRPTNIID